MKHSYNILIFLTRGKTQRINNRIKTNREQEMTTNELRKYASKASKKYSRKKERRCQKNRERGKIMNIEVSVP
jgi:hypothetical protein